MNRKIPSKGAGQPSRLVLAKHHEEGPASLNVISTKTLDFSEAVDRYLGMTQVCLDVALGALEKQFGSKEAALKMWRTLEHTAARHRNERSLVRWNHGGAR